MDSKLKGPLLRTNRLTALTLALLIALVLTFLGGPGQLLALGEDGWPRFDEIDVESYSVIDAETGQQILAKNPDRKRSNASTTKIMTALVLVEDPNFDPDLLLTVSAKSLYFLDPNSARLQALQEGDQISTLDCLAALLIASANDIARVIAQNYGGAYGAIDLSRRGDASASQELFVQRMNQRAADLGATSTHFTNPAGFDEADYSHYTTTHDLALIAAEAMKHPLIAHIVSLSNYRMQVTPQHAQAWWGVMSNSNGLVLYGAQYLESQYYEQYTGVKTGTTPQAGKCLVGSGITHDGRTFVCAAMGIQATDMKSTPFLARAIPVRAIMEEAARLEGVPAKSPDSLLALPLVEEPEVTAPLETTPGQSPETSPSYTEPRGEDPFFAGGIGQTNPIILVLATLGVLALIGGIVAAVIALLIFLRKRRASRLEDVFDDEDKW